MILEELYSIIGKRRVNLPKGSYVVSLFKEGEDRILQKIGEETTEVIVAAKGRSKQRIIEEVADLFFMILVLLAEKRIPLKDIFNELEKRRR